MSAPASGPELAIEFALADDEVVLHKVLGAEAVFTCVKLTLHPEEGEQQWARAAKVQFPTELPAAAKLLPRKKAWRPKSVAKKAEGCAAAGGVYVRLDRLQRFVNGAVNATDVDGSECAAASAEAAPAKPDSPLRKAIGAWNDRFFNMETAETRQNAELFRGRGIRREPKHLAQEVTHFVMPADVQARIDARLATHRTLLLGDEGAGQGGTTGAHFLSGNVGFGNAGQGGNLMDLIFPHRTNATVDTSLFDDSYDRRRGGVLSGEISTRRATAAEASRLLTSRAEAGDADADRPPDLLAFEAEVSRLLLARSDVHYKFGSEVDFQFQHRLWRYGPNFDPKAKGGIWHKDTCPFGINGVLPEGSIMFTIVYILFTENLDGPTAGTRVRDSDGTIFSLPCIAGEGNIIRSGESDPNAFFHSGPLNIRKRDGSKPAYRVMLQSKAILRPLTGRPRAIPTKGNWRGLQLAPLVLPAEAAPYEKLDALEGWLRAASDAADRRRRRVERRRVRGVPDQRAPRVGGDARPLDLPRLPDRRLPARERHAGDARRHLRLRRPVLAPPRRRPRGQRLPRGRRRQRGGLRRAAQVRPGRVLEHADRLRRRHRARGLAAAQLPYDLHLVVDVPPRGKRALKQAGGLLRLYGGVLAEVAAKAKGEGRVATITFLSQQMPAGGRDGGDQSGAAGTLSALQHAYLEAEREWVQFGEAHGVRVVIMRVADRIYAPGASALKNVATSERKSPNPCRVDECADDEPLTRIHTEDLCGALRRMLAMFDIVDTHGADSSMRGTASMSSSISRFPTGTVLEVVDDGPPPRWPRPSRGRAPPSASSSRRPSPRTPRRPPTPRPAERWARIARIARRRGATPTSRRRSACRSCCTPRTCTAPPRCLGRARSDGMAW